MVSMFVKAFSAVLLPSIHLCVCGEICYVQCVCPLELLIHLPIPGRVIGSHSSYSPSQERRASVSPSVHLICLPLINKLFASVGSVLLGILCRV